jgi:hypothetical protein
MRTLRRSLAITLLLAGCTSDPSAGDALPEDDGDGGASTVDGATPAPSSDGASSSDAGVDAPSDADAADAPREITAAPTPCPGPFALCEDFEKGIDKGTWTVTNTPAIDAARSHWGTQSLHFSSAAQLRTTKPFPKLQYDMWGRVFVYMVATPPGSTTTNLGPNASFGASGGGGGLYRFGFRHTRFSAGWNYPKFDQTNTDDLVWPLDSWVCVEWHHVSDPATGNGTQDYWMNGVSRPKMHFDPHPMPPFTYFWIAEYLFGSDYDMWMDDLALDTAQIGCDR